MYSFYILWSNIYLFYGEEKYDFKCLDYLVMPFVLRAINGEEVKPEDSVFIYEGRKCQLLDLPEIKINL